MSKKRQSKKKHLRHQQQTNKQQMLATVRGTKLTPSQKIIQSAQKAWEQLDRDKAVKLFERACRVAPKNLDAKLALGKAYLLHYQPEKAQEIFEKTLEASQNNTHVLYSIGEAYQQLPDYQTASKYYQKAILNDDAPLGCYLEQAESLSRLLKIDQALEILAQAEQRSPGHVLIRHAQGQMYFRKKDYQRSQELLEDVVNHAENDYTLRWKARYTLAAIQDKQGNAEMAMHLWKQAKTVLKAQSKPYMQLARKMSEESAQTLATVTPVPLLHWHQRAASLEPAKPLALLTGHPRTGTTLIEQMLDAHQGLISMDEVPVFANEVSSKVRRIAGLKATIPEIIDSMTDEEWRSHRNTYWNYAGKSIREPLGERMLLDKNPALTPQLPLFCSLFPEAKIFVALRDPRDVVMSCYTQMLPMNNISCCWLDLETTCKLYAETMQAWLTLKPIISNPWHELKYEKLVENPEREGRQVLEFLGLPWDDNVMNYHQHAQTKQVNSPTYQDVTQKIYKGAIGRWKKYESELAPHLHILEPYIKAFGYEPSDA